MHLSNFLQPRWKVYFRFYICVFPTMMTDRIPTDDNITALLGYMVCVCMYKVVEGCSMYIVLIFFLVKS